MVLISRAAFPWLGRKRSYPRHSTSQHGLSQACTQDDTDRDDTTISSSAEYSTLSCAGPHAEYFDQTHLKVFQWLLDLPRHSQPPYLSCIIEARPCFTGQKWSDPTFNQSFVRAKRDMSLLRDYLPYIRRWRPILNDIHRAAELSKLAVEAQETSKDSNRLRRNDDSKTLRTYVDEFGSGRSDVTGLNSQLASPLVPRLHFEDIPWPPVASMDEYSLFPILDATKENIRTFLCMNYQFGWHEEVQFNYDMWRGFALSDQLLQLVLPTEKGKVEDLVWTIANVIKSMPEVAAYMKELWEEIGAPMGSEATQSTASDSVAHWEEDTSFNSSVVVIYNSPARKGCDNESTN